MERTIEALEKRLIKVEKQLSALMHNLGKAALPLGGKSADDGSKDELFIESAKILSKYEKASSSLIQRRLSVGYARAARIMDQLYEVGLIGPDNGSKPRNVNSEKIAIFLQKNDINK